jgi:hypothetical protein
LASDEEFWGSRVAMLSCEPPPPRDVQLIFRPGESLHEQTIADVRSWFRGRRVHIVGGQRDSRLVERIAETVGISTSDIHWLSSERHKQPRIAQRWVSLSAARDVAVCITGRISHATWNAAKQYGSAVPYVEVERAGEIVDRLVALTTSAR